MSELNSFLNALIYLVFPLLFPTFFLLFYLFLTRISDYKAQAKKTPETMEHGMETVYDGRAEEKE